MGILNGLKPERVMYYFEEITKIPHGSGNTKKISDYCVNFAKEHNLLYIQDDSNNVIIKKPAYKGCENAKPVIIQGHIDMVCEKDDDCNIDFTKDALDLKVNGDLIYAKGTTLGGDDGIAVAYALAILESDDIKHPAIEVVLTVDEEIGMLGAQAIDLSSLEGKQLLNIDCEVEGIFTVSCAGGARAECVLPVVRKEIEGNIYNITISGLKGGHSGVEIDKLRGNSNVLAARLLNKLSKKAKINIVSINGGLKDNAIPLKTVAEIVSDSEIDIILEEYNNILKDEYKTSDSDVTVTFEKSYGKAYAMNDISSSDVIFLLLNLPDGIQKMSAEIPGLVETSLNMGILISEKDKVNVSFALRSSKKTALEALIEKLENITEYVRGELIISGEYSPWEYKTDSKLRSVMTEAYKELYGKEPVIEAIHAGLECGVLSEKIEGLDCIAFGPNMYDIHTSNERLSISSTERTWNLIRLTLEKLSEN